MMKLRRLKLALAALGLAAALYGLITASLIALYITAVFTAGVWIVHWREKRYH